MAYIRANIPFAVWSSGATFGITNSISYHVVTSYAHYERSQNTIVIDNDLTKTMFLATFCYITLIIEHHILSGNIFITPSCIAITCNRRFSLPTPAHT